MATWIILFIILDLIAVVVVLWFVLARRRLKPPRRGDFDVGSVTRFADEVHGQIGDYLRIHYSGDPETLVRVLPELIGRIENRARTEGLELGPDVLETIVTRSIVGHGVARERDVLNALEDLRPEATL